VCSGIEAARAGGRRSQPSPSTLPGLTPVRPRRTMPPMRPLPPPPPFRLKLYLSSPAFVLPMLALALSPSLYQLLARAEPSPVVQLPHLDTTPAMIPFDLMRGTLGALPAPAPNQRKAGQCVQGIEVEINGGCWMATDKRPPCPEPRGGWAFYAHEGKCWVPVANTPRVPTSGGSQQAGVAGEP
jgi:hypothetical protein